MSSKLSEFALKKRTEPQKLRAQGWITVIERNRGRFAADYGESIVTFPSQSACESAVFPVNIKKARQIPPFSAKMGTAKPACPQSRLFQVLQFQQAVGGASPVRSKSQNPQPGHWDGFLPRSFWMRASVESRSFFTRDVPACTLQIRSFFCLPRLDKNP